MIWITFSTGYFKVADIPVYIKPDKDMLLLRLDYLGFYFPKIFFLKFGYVKSILTTSLCCETRNTEYEVTDTKIVDCIDLSEDFLKHADVERINYKLIPECFYDLLMGNSQEIRKYKDCYEPLIPFFRFAGLEKKYLDLME